MFACLGETISGVMGSCDHALKGGAQQREDHEQGILCSGERVAVSQTNVPDQE